MSQDWVHPSSSPSRVGPDASYLLQRCFWLSNQTRKQKQWTRASLAEPGWTNALRTCLPAKQSLPRKNRPSHFPKIPSISTERTEGHSMMWGRVKCQRQRIAFEIWENKKWSPKRKILLLTSTRNPTWTCKMLTKYGCKGTAWLRKWPLNFIFRSGLRQVNSEAFWWWERLWLECGKISRKKLSWKPSGQRLCVRKPVPLLLKVWSGKILSQV